MGRQGSPTAQWLLTNPPKSQKDSQKAIFTFIASHKTCWHGDGIEFSSSAVGKWLHHHNHASTTIMHANIQLLFSEVIVYTWLVTAAIRTTIDCEC